MTRDGQMVQYKEKWQNLILTQNIFILFLGATIRNSRHPPSLSGLCTEPHPGKIYSIFFAQTWFKICNFHWKFPKLYPGSAHTLGDFRESAVKKTKLNKIITKYQRHGSHPRRQQFFHILILNIVFFS